MTFIPAGTTDPAITNGRVAVLDNAMPGGHLAWTAARRLTGATMPLQMIDTLGAGQAFDAAFVPRLTLWSNGVATYSGDLTGYTITRPSDGTTLIGFGLQGAPLAGADEMRVTFHSVISPAMPVGGTNRPLSQGDTLRNSAVLAGQVGPADTADATLPHGSVTSSVYAVNGVVLAGAAHAALGDLVTYRFRLHLPLSAAQHVQVVAVPPGVAGTTTFDGFGRGATPAAGHAQWGPAATYTNNRPSIAPDASGGLRFDFGDVQPIYGPGMSDIDVLFTAPLGGLSGNAPTMQAIETESNSLGVVSQSGGSAALALDRPRLRIQAASLYASGEDSQFSGSGGPWGFDIYTSQFGGVVSSAGLAAEPFDDRVWDVDAGDVITFVIAVQNLADRAAAYDLRLQDTMPQGFTVPDDGVGLSVTDGASTPIPFTGDLFDPVHGLLLGAPVAGYDPNSGRNVVLLTFTLQASAQLRVPKAALTDVARIIGYGAQPGGGDLSGSLTPSELQASTPVVTTGIGLEATPDQTSTTLRAGQQAQFDVTVTLPEGETRALRIDELLPHNGDSWLELVSSEIIHVGTKLSMPDLSMPGRAVVQPDGSVAFGTVTNAPDDEKSYADVIVVRVTVRGGGSGGVGTLQTVVSTADPNGAGTVTKTVSNTLTLVAPNTAPTITGTRAGQNATTTMQVHPFAGLVLADPDLSQLQTLTIQLANPALGTFAPPAQGSFNPMTGTFVVQGSIASVQAAARALLFSATGNRTGSEDFIVTLDDGAGGLTTDSGASLRLVAPAPAAAGIQHFAPSPTGTVLTSTATGKQTVAQIETYHGPVDYLQSQFIYDGTDPLAIVAQTPDIFIKNVAGTAAVQLLSGRNVVDAGPGSNFLLGGTGDDVFFLDGRQNQETWNTIVGFHTGDIATIFGYREGVSRYWWEDSAGAAGYTGRTLRADLTGSGHIEASLTFAGTRAADTASYSLTTGNVQGNDYMTIFAL